LRHDYSQRQTGPYAENEYGGATAASAWSKSGPFSGIWGTEVTQRGPGEWGKAPKTKSVAEPQATEQFLLIWQWSLYI